MASRGRVFLSLDPAPDKANQKGGAKKAAGMVPRPGAQMKMKKALREFFFFRAQHKAEVALCRLRIHVEKARDEAGRPLGRLERREIYKDLLRAAGFAGIRIRERRAP